MIDEKLLENYEDAKMVLLMDAYARSEGEALMAEAEKLEESFSEEFKSQCMGAIDKAFAKRRRKEWMRSTVVRTARAAVIAFAVLGTLSLGAMSVPGIRIPVTNMILEQKEKLIRFFIGEGVPADPAEGFVQEGPLAGLLSDVYRLDTHYVSKNGRTKTVYTTESCQDVLYITRPWEGAGMRGDTGNTMVYEETRLLTYPAMLAKKNGYHIIWFNNSTGVVHELSADAMEYEEFWSLAEKIAEMTN